MHLVLHNSWVAVWLHEKFKAFTSKQEHQEQRALIKKENKKHCLQGGEGGSRVGVMCGLFAGVTLLIGRTYNQLFLRICGPVCSLLCMYHFLSITLALQELQNLFCIFPPLN